jgi:hypothetical protein
MEPANFPERKRQRQLRALARLKASTAGKPWKGIEPRSNDAEFLALHRATAESQRDVRTKKDRSDRGRFTRTA